jgi:hypothetical protein
MSAFTSDDCTSLPRMKWLDKLLGKEAPTVESDPGGGGAATVRQPEPEQPTPGPAVPPKPDEPPLHGD